jgi:hypothetical protein
MTEGARAAQIIDEGQKTTGIAPKFWVGDALTGTDEDGQVMVLVDGPDPTTTDDELTTDDANQPIIARCWGNSVATGERVNLVSLPDGSTWVVGSTAGQPRCIGVSVIAGGAADVPVFSTAATPITDLETEAQVLHPDHLIGIDVNVYLESAADTNILVGRVRRQDEDGNTVEVARFLRSNQLSNNQTLVAGVRVYDYAPEPENYIYFPTVQAQTTGWALILDPATTPETAASLVVTDLGPLPPSATRTT